MKLLWIMLVAVFMAGAAALNAGQSDACKKCCGDDCAACCKGNCEDCCGKK
jgi:hypothetical protein